MNEEFSDEDLPAVAEETPRSCGQVGSLLMSLAFWSALLVSAAMYAAVALSPKLGAWINVRQQFIDNAERLAVLEEEADYLERVADALKNDPTFAQQLTGASQGDFGTTAEFSAANSPHPAHRIPDSAMTPLMLQPQLATLVFHLASHERHRSWLLGLACALTLTAFSLLNEAGASVVGAVLSGIRSTLWTAIARYRKSDQ